jgi:hypothetical protein
MDATHRPTGHILLPKPGGVDHLIDLPHLDAPRAISIYKLRAKLARDQRVFMRQARRRPRCFL